MVLTNSILLGKMGAGLMEWNACIQFFNVFGNFSDSETRPNCVQTALFSASKIGTSRLG